MTELTEFLLARISEKEEQARTLQNWMRLEGVVREWLTELNDDDPDLTEWIDEDAKGTAKSIKSVLIRLGLPERILAECRAERRIVETCDAVIVASADKPDDSYEAGAAFGLVAVCAGLALPYTDHPDYDERWRP